MAHDEKTGVTQSPEEVEQAIEEQAARKPPDPQTTREAVELGLMDEDASEAGEDLGEHIE